MMSLNKTNVLGGLNISKDKHKLSSTLEHVPDKITCVNNKCVQLALFPFLSYSFPHIHSYKAFKGYLRLT